MKSKFSSSKLMNDLKASRKPADAAFVDALKQKLVAQAQFTLPGKTASGLALIVHSMKRYSLAYITGLLLLAMGVLILIPKGMNPEDFLAKAAEEYGNSEGIFHEERLSQRFENGIVVEASLEETWAEESTGNFLHVVRNPDTNEIVQVTMDKNDAKTQESKSYQSSSLSEPSEDEMHWYETYSGPKFECIKIDEISDQRINSYLKIAPEDPSIYTIEGDVENLSLEGSYTEENPTAELLSGTASPSIVKDLLSDFQNAALPQQRAYEDGNYFVFEWHTIARDGDGDHLRTAYYYFNTETYKLEKMKLTFEDEPNRYDLTTYVTHEVLPSEQSEKIFDPNLYEVTEIPVIGAGSVYNYEKNGCYYEGEALNEEETIELFQEVPSEAIMEWESLHEEILNSLQKNSENSGSSNPDEESDSVLESLTQVPFIENPDFELIMPTEGNITQAYHSGHYGIDIANRAKPDVLAAASGTVRYISEGSWDGGYGSNIWIDHGNGYLTHYTHLDSINVELNQIVNRGDVIGVMGNTGRVYGSSGVHLHFELVIDGMKVNPADYFIEE